VLRSNRGPRLGRMDAHKRAHRLPPGRREDFTWLREEQGLTIEQAADRLGVSFRVAQRYEAARKRAAR
jgi:DNA-binding transcriptional regulator YiaG